MFAARGPSLRICLHLWEEVIHEKVRFHPIHVFIDCRRRWCLQFALPCAQTRRAPRGEACDQTTNDDSGFFEAGMWVQVGLGGIEIL